MKWRLAVVAFVRVHEQQSFQQARRRCQFSVFAGRAAVGLPPQRSTEIFRFHTRHRIQKLRQQRRSFESVFHPQQRRSSNRRNSSAMCSVSRDRSVDVTHDTSEDGMSSRMDPGIQGISHGTGDSRRSPEDNVRMRRRSAGNWSRRNKPKSGAHVHCGSRLWNSTLLRVRQRLGTELRCLHKMTQNRAK